MITKMFVFVAILSISGCSKHVPERDKTQAISLARSEIRKYCVRENIECRSFAYDGIDRYGEGWIVGFKSKKELVAVTVTDEGKLELGRMPAGP